MESRRGMLEAKRPVKSGDSCREEPGHDGAGSEAGSTRVEGMMYRDILFPRPERHKTPRHTKWF